jgi:hypothetical protein
MIILREQHRGQEVRDAKSGSTQGSGAPRPTGRNHQPSLPVSTTPKARDKEARAGLSRTMSLGAPSQSKQVLCLMGKGRNLEVRPNPNCLAAGLHLPVSQFPYVQNTGTQVWHLLQRTVPRIKAVTSSGTEFSAASVQAYLSLLLLCRCFPHQPYPFNHSPGRQYGRRYSSFLGGSSVKGPSGLLRILSH